MKQFNRRLVTKAVAGLAAVPMAPWIAKAQGYPQRSVRIIVGFAPGGAGDITARLLAKWLSEKCGQPFIVENRPGAGTNVATEAVVRAVPDGHTLLWVTSANAISASLYGKLSFDFVRDIAPVAGVSRVPLALVVNPAVPARNLPELIKFAKANPGKLNMASSGNGSANHVAGELLKMMASISMAHVPYRGGAPALSDVLSGHVQMMFDPIIGLVDHVRSGTVRALAVTTANRTDTLPDVPPVADTLPGYEASTWNGIGAPRGTLSEIVSQLNAYINDGLNDLNLRKQLAELGGIPLTGSEDDFGRLIDQEIEKWAKVIKFAGIKLD